MSKNHTPTPWIVGRHDIYPASNCCIMEAKQSGAYKSLAKCFTMNRESDEANAAFIVKAANNHDYLVELLGKLVTYADISCESLGSLALVREAEALLNTLKTKD